MPSAIAARSESAIWRYTGLVMASVCQLERLVHTSWPTSLTTNRLGSNILPSWFIQVDQVTPDRPIGDSPMAVQSSSPRSWFPGRLVPLARLARFEALGSAHR